MRHDHKHLRNVDAEIDSAWLFAMEHSATYRYSYLRNKPPGAHLPTPDLRLYSITTSKLLRIAESFGASPEWRRNNSTVTGYAVPCARGLYGKDMDRVCSVIMSVLVDVLDATALIKEDRPESIVLQGKACRHARWCANVQPDLRTLDSRLVNSVRPEGGLTTLHPLLQWLREYGCNRPGIPAEEMLFVERLLRGEGVFEESLLAADQDRDAVHYSGRSYSRFKARALYASMDLRSAITREFPVYTTPRCVAAYGRHHEWLILMDREDAGVFSQWIDQFYR